MVCLDRVVGVLLGVVHCGRDELVEDPWIRGRLVRGDLNGLDSGGKCPGEERPSGSQVTPGGQPYVDDLPILVDRPLQVRPPAVDLDVGLVNEPAVTRHVTACSCRFDELRCESLDPPVNGDVIDRDTTLGEQLLDVPVGQAALLH